MPSVKLFVVGVAVILLGSLPVRTIFAGENGTFVGALTLISGSSTASDVDGGSNFTNAMLLLDNSEGSVEAFSQISDQLRLPEMGMRVTSKGQNLRARGVTRAQSQYKYIGSSTTTLTLDVSLEAVITGDPIVTISKGPLVTDVAVISGNNISFSTSNGGHAGTLLGETIPSSLELDLIAHERLFLDYSAGSQSMLAEIPISLSPGEVFYVWAEMIGFVGQGETIDGLNTLSMSFSNPANITPIPEPSALVLGLLAVSAASIRQRF